MKKLLITNIGTWSLILLLFSCRSNVSTTGIKITETNNATKFEANYNPEKTDRVITFLNENLSTDIFESGPNQDKDVKLGDSMRFHLWSREGELELKFEKKSNKESAYKYLGKLSRKIGKVIE